MTPNRHERSPRRTRSERGGPPRPPGRREAGAAATRRRRVRGEPGPVARDGGAGRAASAGRASPARRGPARAEPGRGTGGRPASRPPDPGVVLDRQAWGALAEVIPAGADAESTLARLREYARLLLAWNRGVSNLISRHDESRLVERHLLESLLPARQIADSGCGEFVDLGSGGGFPAIPLALAGVGSRWVLVESRRNKTLFLRKVVHDLQMESVSVVNARLETMIEDGVEIRGDALTSRATMRLAPTLDLAAAVVRPGGRAFLWKGSGLADELEHGRSVWSRDWSHLGTAMLGEGPNVLATFARTDVRERAVTD